MTTAWCNNCLHQQPYRSQLTNI